ncbi:alpha/beta fold hydrolase [Actinokineospora sp. UTMC 2448]|uniref:alpha/beta fold hydrolase n=1 Tax=Actinokineospora sp. UTMC 2448 TaxID=2268449 RepID=UPI0021647559|nr:alpha/beta fold hydrolase [Actinokineospora sp. UTMC 2448]
MTTLVLLHAFPMDSRMWDGVRSLPGLITPDLPGFGSAPLPASEPDLGAMADAVIASMDDEGVERAVVGGCSMGGYVAMALLRKAPARVSGLLLVDTKATADAQEAAANRLAVAERAEREGITPWLADAMLPSLVADPAHAGVVRELMESQDPAAVAWAQRAMAARPASHDVLRTSVPTLVVHGAEDRMMPVALAEELADLTSGTLTVLPGVGHLPPIEAPEAFAAAVRPWLAGL